MADNKLFYSKTFIKNLLIVRALLKTDYEAPKTSQQILHEVEGNFKKFFPDEKFAEKTATISRHVRDMNQSGLFSIKVHPDNKRGYFNARQILTTAEASVMGAAIYQTASLTVDEKKDFFDKIKLATDTDGGSIIYSFEQQIKSEEKLHRKIFQASLPKIKTICKAIVESKKLTFYLRQDSLSKEGRQVTASPYFVVVKDNELYLAAKVDDSPKLTDFKLALMSRLEICKDEFRADRNFSLNRHLSETCKDEPKVELKISFPESFIEKVIEQFELNRIRTFAPVRKFSDGEWQFHATIFVSENDVLYQWLRQNCNKVNVHSPISVQKSLKAQLQKALSIL